MIEITAPSNCFVSLTPDADQSNDRYRPFICELCTLGAAIARYCKHFKSTVRPYEGEKSAASFADGMSIFLIYDDPALRFRDCFVRVSVERSANQLYQHLDLDMMLEDGDKVRLEALAC